MLQDGDSIIDIFPNLTAITVKRPLPGLENLHLIGGYSVGLSEEKDEKYSTSKYRVDQNDVLKQYKKPQNKNWTSEDYERFIQQQRAKERLADEVVALSALDRAAALRIVKGEVISEGELTTIIHILTSAVPS